MRARDGLFVAHAARTARALSPGTRHACPYAHHHAHARLDDGHRAGWGDLLRRVRDPTRGRDVRRPASTRSGDGRRPLADCRRAPRRSRRLARRADDRGGPQRLRAARTRCDRRRGPAGSRAGRARLGDPRARIGTGHRVHRAALVARRRARSRGPTTRGGRRADHRCHTVGLDAGHTHHERARHAMGDAHLAPQRERHCRGRPW